ISIPADSRVEGPACSRLRVPGARLQMKTLLLVRHAKALPFATTGVDADRPLSEEGLQDAVRMAARLQQRGIRPDRFLSSPALRALTTARIFADCFSLQPSSIEIRPALYMPRPHAFMEDILSLPDEVERA